MTSKNKIIEAIEAAQGSWTGSDWEHKVDIAEREVYEYSTIDEDDQEVTNYTTSYSKAKRFEAFEFNAETIYCSNYEGDEECSYCKEAKLAAEEAEEYALEAIEALKENRLDDALEAVTIASRLESYYGDDPTWGEPRRLLEAAATKELK